MKELLTSTVKNLKGCARRLFLAQSVNALGEGGQRQAQRELGWNRNTIRKGMHELESGITCIDNLSARGRKRAEEHLLVEFVDKYQVSLQGMGSSGM